jgi:hypothetical protein
VKITLGNRQSAVVLTTEQDRYVREVVERATGSALRSMEQAVSEIYAHAKSEWPYGRGHQKHSADQMVKGTRIVSDSKGYYIGGYIGNDAPWAYYIKTQNIDPYGSAPEVTLAPPLPLENAEPSPRRRPRKYLHAYTELIRKPFNARLESLADELQRETAQIARRL